MNAFREVDKIVFQGGLRPNARLAAVLFLCTLALTAIAHADPIAYTAFTITDGQLGSWSFTNAQVYITFQSDTSFAQTTVIGGVNVSYVGPYPPDQLCTGPATSVGTATITIIAKDRTVHATFAPNQLFVSIDLDNGGSGIGSCSPYSPFGFEPTYPIGVEDGTIDEVRGDAINPSPEVANLSTDLAHDTGFSGRAWICPGFPDRTCPNQVNALRTDQGDLYLYQPYQEFFDGDSLSSGFFYAVSGSGLFNVPSTDSIDPPGSITYNAFVISDATLGSQYFTGARVYVSAQANPATAVPLLIDKTSSGYINHSLKNAQVTILTDNGSITAHFLPGQLYVYFDVQNSSVGFGSYLGGRGYPLSLTENKARSTVENSLVGGVADLMRTGDTANYTQATQSLETKLATPTVLGGPASSCIPFNPVNSYCPTWTSTPIALKTDMGNFYLFEHYTDGGDRFGNPTPPYSVNFGMFWAQ